MNGGTLLVGLPPWAKRFAASCVAYVEEEKTALAEVLTAASLSSAAEARAAEAAAAEEAAAEAAVAAAETAAAADGKGGGGGDTKEGGGKKCAKAKALLTAPPPPQTEEEAAAEASAARAEAEAEAAGVASGRMQSLAVTLDKVRHVLSVQLGDDADAVAAAPPPLVALTPDEASWIGRSRAQQVSRRRLHSFLRQLHSYVSSITTNLYPYTA